MINYPIAGAIGNCCISFSFSTILIYAKDAKHDEEGDVGVGTEKDKYAAEWSIMNLGFIFRKIRLKFDQSGFGE